MTTWGSVLNDVMFVLGIIAFGGLILTIIFDINGKVWTFSSIKKKTKNVRKSKKTV